jgi:ABC-type dipeptide/oligopeptide/nickel transport system ATPase subunit
VIAAEGVSVAYGRRRVLDEVSLSIARGETVGLRGPSGAGKSTLLRVLALLHRPAAGQVSIDGTPIRGIRYAVPAGVRRKIGVLFQSPRAAADPRLSLADLIAEPLRVARNPSTAARVAELADTVGLTADLLTRRPHAVSDGQLQRACLARALAHQPEYLLCDEATAMLDAATQALIAGVIKEYQKRHRTGVLLVTHDPALMTRWADRVVDIIDRHPAVVPLQSAEPAPVAQRIERPKN